MRPRLSAQEGAALVIALLFLTLFGVFGGLLLQYGQTNLKGTGVARAADAKVFAADAGIDYAIEKIRTDLSLCPDPSLGTMNLPSLTVNGRTVNVTCQTTEGMRSGGVPTNPYAVIVTSTASDSLKSSSGGDSKITGGPVYVRGGMDLRSTTIVEGGDVSQYSSTCPGSLSQPSRLTVVAPHVWQCVTTPTPTVVNTLPVPVPADAPAPVSITSDCKLFKPGRYTSVSLLTGGNKQNYFASGVYYFDNVGVIDVANNTLLWGGQPGASETQQLPGTPCASDADSGGAAYGKGVKFILGGNSHFTVKNNTTFELFTRQPTTVAEGSPYSIVAVQSGSPGWTPWSDSNSILSVTTGGAGAIVHGFVYAPNASVDLFASNNTIAQLQNGVIASKLHLQASGSAAALAISVAPFSPGLPRTILLTATAQATDPGEVAVVHRAVIKVDNDVSGLFPVTINSWRKV